MTSPQIMPVTEAPPGMDRDWLAVASLMICLVFSVGTLTLYCFGVFVAPLSTQFGWGRTKIIVALTISQYMLAVMLPIWGTVTDRIGPRLVVPISAITLSLAFASLALLTPHIWHLYLIFALIPVLAGGSTPLGSSAVLVQRFRKHLGLSMGFSLMGVGLGAAVLPPLAQNLIAQHGWRTAIAVIGAITLLFTLPAALIATRNTRGPAVSRLIAGPTSILPMVQTRAFVLMSSVFLLLGIASVGVLVNLVPMMADRGVAPGTAAKMAALAGVMALIGRAVIGWVLDHVYAPRVLATFALVASASFLLFDFAHSAGPTLLAVILLGLVVGAEVDCIGFMVRQYFPPQAFGRLYGVAFGLILVGTGTGPLLLSYLHDRFSTYGEGLLLFAAIGIVCAAVTLAMPRYEDVRFSSLYNSTRR